MDSVDLEVLRSASSWLKSGHAVVLATVVKTWGSAPRPLGAMLAIRDDGQVSGSVSGGCVEDDLIERVHQHKLASDKPEVATYGVTKEQAERFGLPCGGTLQLVLEPVRDKRRAGRTAARHRAPRTGGAIARPRNGEVGLSPAAGPTCSNSTARC